MKNFSAKNAEFETLKINNEAAISSADLGTAPNQIPLNKDLGSLAYQDAVNLDDVSADMLELRAIAAEISDSAVDVFVYDTSRDSDGGAWRKRTQHTSWYNEELNTATRGARREFPAVAVIVAEADKVTIYDGDDPDLSMWMVFQQGSVLEWASTSSNCTSLSFLNGVLVVGSRPSSVILFNFLGDDIKLTYFQNQYFLTSGRFIVDRNNSISVSAGGDGIDIVNNNVNDVAMTILPNAPIDDDTGLPVPTIAVATDGGVSVIKDDGTVVDITVSNSLYSYAKNVNFTTSNDFITVIGGSSSHDYIFVFDGIPNSDNVMTIDSRIGSSQDARSMFRKNYIADSTVFDGFTIGNGGSQSQMIQTIQGDRFVCGNNYDGLTIIDDNNLGFQKKDLVYISSKYNTGWMPGDIKLATLSDTTVENIGVNSDELVANGGFNSDYTGWVGEDASLTNANHPDSGSNSLLVTPTALPAPGKAKQDLATVSGQRYVLSASIAFGAGCTKISILDNSGGIINEDYFPGDGNRTITIYVNGDVVMSELRLVAYGGPAYFDNISVRATTELITNGDFSNGTTGWTAQEDNGTFTASNGVATIAYVTGPTSYEQYVTTVIGKTYTLSFDITAISTSQPQFYYNTGSGDVGMAGMDDTGVKTSTFVANSTSTRIWVRCPFEGSFDIDNISVRPAEEDRSVNNNGLQIVGEINKTPVAPGADLVAYSGFSANDYLVQPYNEDLDFGTGDFCVMGWFKSSDISSTGFLIDNSDQDTTTNLNLKARFAVYKESSVLKFYTNNNVVNSEVQSSSLSSNIWYFFTAKRANGNIVLYVNGEQVDSNSDNSINLSNTSSTLAVGVNWNRSGPASSEDICLLRISKTAPTDDQIAKIYRDEKALFQDGAQATLYGTSDSVTALAYDEKTELLHVGTASGRSDFSGLRRINNTTTAITTSISAHNNLIAEQ